jgi:hypothetical protein
MGLSGNFQLTELSGSTSAEHRSFYEVFLGDQLCQNIKMFRRFEDQLCPIFRVLGSDWWPGILWSGIYSWLVLQSLPSTLKMGTELFLETSEAFNILTPLLARENFIEFSRRENIKTYCFECCVVLF